MKFGCDELKGATVDTATYIFLGMFLYDLSGPLTAHLHWGAS